jgi:hypothetical protein
MVSFMGCGVQSSLKILAKNIAASSGMRPILLRTSTFSLAGFYKFRSEGPLTIYIEGDGLAWLTHNRPSANPTPRNPIALRLAALDQSDNVAYLARPCQYVSLEYENSCDVSFWTQKRFAKEVILAVNEAIDIMASKAGSEEIHLVGYSGGGAVAAIAAAFRKDVVSLRTVAGYMDHVTLNREVGVSTLTGSFDPMLYAPRIKSIPQIHYTGRQDTRIPGWVAQNFQKAVGNKRCSSVRKVNATHEKGWEELWKRAWSKIPACR